VVHVRPATTADLDFLVSGNLEMALETENLRLDPDTVRTAVRALLDGRQAGRYWVAEVDDVPAGQLLVTFEWSDWRNRMIWWIQSVYTTPAARRHGVYRALYAHVRQEAQAAGACGLRLYVDTRNTRAQQVYASLGMNGDHYRVFEEMF
jgi:GNAT superfamily N-acetyltransferase